MSLPWNITNPGFVIGTTLTSTESALVTDLASLTYSTGDILYYDSGFNNLAIGSTGQVLTVSAGGIVEWTTVSGTGDVTAASAFSTDNVLIKSDGTGKGVQATGITVADTTDAMSGMASITIDASGSLLFGAVTIISDSSGTTTLSNIDAIDATTQSTLESTLGFLVDVVDDTTPQLGGNLDVQSNSIITSTVNGGITLTPNGTGNVTLGTMVFDSDQTIGAGQDNYVLTYDNATGLISLEASAGGGTGDLWSDAVDSDIVPTGADSTYDLGTSTDRFAQTHTDEIFSGNWVALGSILTIKDSTNTNNIIALEDSGTAVNYLRIYNSATGSPLEMWAEGTDTNIDVGIAPKGSGALVIGDGTNTGKVESNGNTDLVLQTGNATTGSITITDGANGNINIAPNGTGEAQVSGNKIIDETDTASTTAAGISELATSAEVNTGTDTSRTITPDALAGSDFGIRYVSVQLNGTTALTTSDFAYFRIPAAMNGMNLVSVSASVGTGSAGSSSSGTPTFVVTNVTDALSMLSTNLTVDANEYTSATAATPAVINTSSDDVATDDLIEVSVSVAGTGVTYATVTLGFQLP